MNTLQRYFHGSEESYFLFGPRGTGKTTWLKQHAKNALWINLLDLAEFRTYSARPERLKEVVLATDKKQIVIDEVQKLPELLDVVHDLIERKQDWQFILTGSSARKLKRTGVNLLAGRAVIRYLHPFMASELGDQFNLQSALQVGLIPLIVSSKNPTDVLNAYIGLYLKEEVQSEGLVRNIGDFSRFLETIAFSHGSKLNVANVARECQVSRKIVEGYVSILDDLLLSFQLPVFTRRAKRATVEGPKFYYFDAGVYRSLRQMGPIDSASEKDGVALEGLVAQHLRAWNDYQGEPYSLCYWRTRHGVEVDFIIYGPDGFWAIEVKNSQQVHTGDLRGLNTFCEDYPEAIPLLLYRGKERLKKNNVLCVPIEEFLLNLSPQSDKLLDQ